MGWFTAAVLFALIWWTVLFAVLPFGTRPIADADPQSGGWRGVPERPLLVRKLIATTCIAALLWGGGIALIASPLLSFRDMAGRMTDD